MESAEFTFSYMQQWNSKNNGLNQSYLYLLYVEDRDKESRVHLASPKRHLDFSCFFLPSTAHAFHLQHRFTVLNGHWNFSRRRWGLQKDASQAEATVCKQFPEAHTVFPLILLARTKSYGHLQLQGKLENGTFYWAALYLAKDWSSIIKKGGNGN